ncbi:MAG: Pantothenate synthetase [Candidatus Omnitrophica bacterium ADurb.Bin205]|nr:MAG: Pantothenate synthetase [Candidatus Omnitrophica bacterium ADurb.Bin205]
MRLIKSPSLINKELKKRRIKGQGIGFVPTMGALHEGHLSLIRQARRDNDIVVVSIFVNPKQFGPKEDLKKYPRPLSKDLKLCRKEGVDFVFFPKNEDIYPGGFSTYVNVEGLDKFLCAKSRPGHFRGVTTIVAKLLNIIAPDVLYLGQKDIQQAVILQRMVKDLNIPVKVKVMPIVRSKDGLALSSRNAYLNHKERRDALVLSQALKLAVFFINNGASDAKRIILRMRQLIEKRQSVRIDYVEIVDPVTLKPLKKVAGSFLIVLAVWVGKTRLIDNFLRK